MGLPRRAIVVARYVFKFARFTKLHIVFPIVLVSSLFTILLATGWFPSLGLFAAYCGILVVAYTGALAIDDYFDFRSDVINGLPRPLVSGEITPKEALIWGNGVIALASIAFFWLFGLKGLALSVFITLYLYLFCYLGNWGKLPFITQIMTVTATNLIAVILPWFIFAIPNLWMVALYIAGVVWDFCHDCSSAILHREGDRAAGRRTAAVELGPKGAAKLALLLRPVWIGMGFVIAARFMGIIAYLVMFAAIVLGFYASVRLARNPSPEYAQFAFKIHTLEFNLITMGFVIDTLLGHPAPIQNLMPL